MVRWFTLMLALYFNAHTAYSFTIGLPESLKGSEIQQQVESKFIELYAGLEDDLSFAYLPIERITHLIEQQQLDAAGYQILDFVGAKHGMIAVPEPLTEFRVVVGCLDKKYCVIDDTLGFAVISDALYTNLYCQTKRLKCLRVDSKELAVKALNEGIVDGFLMQRSPYITPPCYARLGLMSYPVVNTGIDTHHFVSKTHQGLVSPLAIRLKQLKASTANTTQNPCEF